MEVRCWLISYCCQGIVESGYLLKPGISGKVQCPLQECPYNNRLLSHNRSRGCPND
jgi:hypothetical protein